MTQTIEASGLTLGTRGRMSVEQPTKSLDRLVLLAGQSAPLVLADLVDGVVQRLFDAGLSARWLAGAAVAQARVPAHSRSGKAAKREKEEIYFEDESGVRSDFHSGKAWAPKGETPIARVTGQRRPVYLIVDGHPSHRAKLVKEYVDSLEGRLKLFFLPPYSPELNPDELVWNDVTNNAVGRAKLEGPKDLYRAVLGRLRFLEKRPDRVRSFFRAPETCYAAA